WTARSSSAAIVYDNIATSITGAFSDFNTNHPIMGDSLTLISPGLLSNFTVSLFNSSANGNTGSIQTGTMLVTFYDNTTPYVSGHLTDPVLGSATLTWDFTEVGGLAPGTFKTGAFDLSSFGIQLPTQILVT